MCRLWNRFMLLVIISLSMLFMFDELELMWFISGFSFFRLGISLLVNLVCCVWVQLWLLVMVLILLLWVRKWKGCVSGYFGRVLVEKCWWNMQIVVCRCLLLRFGQKVVRLVGIIRFLQMMVLCEKLQMQWLLLVVLVIDEWCCVLNSLMVKFWLFRLVLLMNICLICGRCFSVRWLRMLVLIGILCQLISFSLVVMIL